jgi:ATP-dependent 26S proteasome regulatory subunit
MVSVMKVDKAPLESYADIGGLETHSKPLNSILRRSVMQRGSTASVISATA